MPNEYVCKACGANFPNESGLREHGSKAHPMPGASPPQVDYACQACGAHFRSEAELGAHASQAHRM